MNLDTYDPYDIWTTQLGFRAKNFYNHHRILGLPLAAILTLFDTYANDQLRLFCSRREYPIVRALAALSLLKLYAATPDPLLLLHAGRHLEWLHEHSCTGFSGPCWGLGFKYAVGKGLIYDSNMPLTTMTPYCLEAFVLFARETDDQRWVSSIRGIHSFLERDIVILEENDNVLVTSYAAMADRRVVNASSYVMYSYALLLPYLAPSQRDAAAVKIQKLYNYVRLNQTPDGSWLYSPDPPSFIDCFHSCIILKNLLKTSSLVDLDGCENVVDRGFAFLKKQMYVPRKGLFKRFARTNKPGLVRFDLYDNAEMLQLAHLMGDTELADSLEANITKAFVHRDQIFSQIDWFGLRRSPGRLRWAILPYIYALACREGVVTP